MKKKKRSGKNKKVNGIEASLLVQPERMIGLDSSLIYSEKLPNRLIPESNILKFGENGSISLFTKNITDSYISDMARGCQIHTYLMEGGLMSASVINDIQKPLFGCLKSANDKLALLTNEMTGISENVSIMSKVKMEALNIVASNQLNIIGESVSKELLGFQSLAITATEINLAVDRTVSLFHDTLKDGALVSNILNESVFAVPTSIAIKEIGKYDRVSIQFENYQPLGFGNNEYQITAVTTEEKDYGLITYETVQKTEMRVTKLESRLDELIDGSEKHDEKLDEILKYFRENGGHVFKVKSVEFNKKTCELKINNRIIEFGWGTLEYDICRIVFNSKSSMNKRWDLEDLVWAMREDADSVNWETKVYDAVRRINDHIEKKTGLDQFVLWVKKTVFVNPHFLSAIT